MLLASLGVVSSLICCREYNNSGYIANLYIFILHPVGDLVRRYTALPLPEGNAASNVHVTKRLRKLTRNELGWLERVDLKKVLTKRLDLYNKTFSFIQRHGFESFWPKGSAALDSRHWQYIEEVSKYMDNFVLKQRYVLTPWVDVRDLLVVTLDKAGVTSGQFNSLCDRDLNLKKL